MAWSRQYQLYDPEAKKRQEITGLVFDFQRFSIHDGPGIRTMVFLKGCPLHCAWCQNPESISRDPEIMLIQNNCIDCGKCIEICPDDAVGNSPEGNRTIDRSRCIVCGECLKVCYANTINISGRYLSVSEVLDVVERDRKFYERTGGGVTFSGGEPTTQAAFLMELARQAKASDLHTAIETCGHFRWDALVDVFNYIDLVLYDIKHMDPEKHYRLTGVRNHLILENLGRVASLGVPVRVRLPLIPGLNDSETNIRATAAFAADLPNLEALDILPYHRLGESKWGELDQKYLLHGVKPHTHEQVSAMFDVAREYDIEVTVGG